MKQLIHFLQNPFFKIVLSPLAFISFGLISGMGVNTQANWMGVILLYLISVSGQLVDHYYFVKYNHHLQAAAPRIIWFVCEIVLLVASGLLISQQHWIVSLLLIMYIAFIHLQYMPYNITQTFSHFALSIFFNGYILNCIAYYSQTGLLNRRFLIALIPIVILMGAIQFEIIQLKAKLMKVAPPRWAIDNSLITFAISIVALFFSLYLCLPSKSFFIIQLLHALLTGAAILPLAIRTQRNKQNQNKLNYLHSVALIFTIMYALSYIY
ncbi:hypothetical protein [Vaginisenegalia massiliensis]|uniref:hypothetical protein n=1 Tax=Vaginisenegalia massiliensis TaxID=2058294 RepID=UPI000F54500F|nr:hypothetical protein [Vaginisenegalia massiliensis]